MTSSFFFRQLSIALTFLVSLSICVTTVRDIELVLEPWLFQLLSTDIDPAPSLSPSLSATAHCTIYGNLSRQPRRPKAYLLLNSQLITLKVMPGESLISMDALVSWLQITTSLSVGSPRRELNQTQILNESQLPTYYRKAAIAFLSKIRQLFNDLSTTTSN